jgi:hypothetical protein
MHAHTCVVHAYTYAHIQRHTKGEINSKDVVSLKPKKRKKKVPQCTWKNGFCEQPKLRIIRNCKYFTSIHNQYLESIPHNSAITVELIVVSCKWDPILFFTWLLCHENGTQFTSLLSWQVEASDDGHDGHEASVPPPFIKTLLKNRYREQLGLTQRLKSFSDKQQQRSK